MSTVPDRSIPSKDYLPILSHCNKSTQVHHSEKKWAGVVEIQFSSSSKELLVDMHLTLDTIGIKANTTPRHPLLPHLNKSSNQISWQCWLVWPWMGSWDRYSHPAKVQWSCYMAPRDPLLQIASFYWSRSEIAGRHSTYVPHHYTMLPIIPSSSAAATTLLGLATVP